MESKLIFICPKCKRVPVIQYEIDKPVVDSKCLYCNKSQVENRSYSEALEAMKKNEEEPVLEDNKLKCNKCKEIPEYFYRGYYFNKELVCLEHVEEKGSYDEDKGPYDDYRNKKTSNYPGRSRGL